jgi:S1-C subfamily serine protease
VKLVRIVALLAASLSPITSQEAPAAEVVAHDEKRVQTSISEALEAVVGIRIPSKAVYSGVVVSQDGYVIWFGSPHPQPDISVVTKSGEIIPAKALGWSVEWRVGLLKLKIDRKWPFAKLGSTIHSKAGDECFEIGYHATDEEKEKREFPRSAVVQRGKLTCVSPGNWFATDLGQKQFEYGAGTFDADGKLLGTAVPGISLTDHVSTAVEIVASHWEHLAGGKNLDWVRYPPSENSLYFCLADRDQLDRTKMLSRNDVAAWKDIPAAETIEEKAFQLARKTAAATTVRIRAAHPGEGPQPGKSSYWSGVIISPDGHIATCAHTWQLSGERLVVVLPDNREVSAVALGTNWVSDIAMVKITEGGPWEFAQLGESSLIRPDDAVLCAGFPVPHRNPLPPVTTAVLPLQRTPYVGWNPELVFRPSLELGGGASGGGVFDRTGRLVAVYLGPGGGHRVEMFRAQKGYLEREMAMADSFR